MSGEDQERFEDYLELEKFIENLQAGHVAHPPRDLTPAQARIYEMGALFHSASPGASQMRPAFVEELQEQLEQELQQKAKKRHFLSPKRERSQKKQSAVSRRSLLTGSAAVAASLAIGAGVEHIIEQAAENAAVDKANTPSVAQDQSLVPKGTPSAWHLVTSLDNLGSEAVRFSTDTVVGYVLRDPGGEENYLSIGDQGQSTDNIIAMSAACTHMGCLVNWEQGDHRFHCPCHGGVFTSEGFGLVVPNTITYLLPLPRFETKIENNNVYVRVPVARK